MVRVGDQPSVANRGGIIAGGGREPNVPNDDSRCPERADVSRM